MGLGGIGSLIKEARTVKKLWERKWLVLTVTVVVFLSVGAVAWAATGDGQTIGATATSVGNAAGGTATTAVCRGDCYGDCGAGYREQGRPRMALRGDLRDKAEQWAQRHQELMDALREDMTPEDQALYDELVQTAKEQREALREARNDLVETLKQLRDLAGKYTDDAS